LWKRKSELGRTRLVCVVKEDLGDEIAEFAKDVWPGGEIYLDKELAFFKAAGGGEVEQKGLLLFLAKYLTPGTIIKRSMAEAKGYKMNLVGEGLIVGGLFVLRKGGAVEYAFREEEIGMHAPLDAVVAAAGRALAAH